MTVTFICEIDPVFSAHIMLDVIFSSFSFFFRLVGDNNVESVTNEMIGCTVHRDLQ